MKHSDGAGERTESAEDGTTSSNWPPHLLRARDAGELVPALERARRAARELGGRRCAGVKFLIDECLSKELRVVAWEFGYEAEAMQHFRMTNLLDEQLHPLVMEGDFTLVTNNRDDWRALLGDEEVHPGLVVIIPNVPRPRQVELFTRALVAMADLDDLVNMVVEVDWTGQVTSAPLP